MLGGASPPEDETPVLSVTAPPKAARSRSAARKTRPAIRAATAELLRSVTLEHHQIAPLYADDGSGNLALRTLPETRRDRVSDTLMLLLYGMLTLRKRSPVTAPALLKSARASNLAISRASQFLTGKGRLVATSGQRRGKRYRLTRDGVSHCEDLARHLLRNLGTRPRGG
jgi:hypothetical protein